jgi:hypothetical protein
MEACALIVLSIIFCCIICSCLASPQAPGVVRHPLEPCFRFRVFARNSGAALAGPMVTGTFHSGKMETEVLSSNF